MKGRPQAEKFPTEIVSNRRSITGVSNDSSQMERGHATVSPTMRNIDIAKMPVTASPDLSSSMAEFLEKEKLCRVSTSGKNIEYGVDTSDHMTYAILYQQILIENANVN
jgi:hypothetical protein